MTDSSMMDFVSNLPYTPRNIFGLVLTTPECFEHPDARPMSNEAFITLIEREVIKVEGLSDTIEVTSTESNTSADYTHKNGCELIIANKYGLGARNYIEYWIRSGISDPDTKCPLLKPDGWVKGTPVSPSWFTADLLFIEPDPTGKRVLRAWHMPDAFPLSNGDLNTGDLNIPLAGKVYCGSETIKIAEDALARRNADSAKPGS